MMVSVELLVQILIAICGLVAGLATLLAATTKLLRAVVDLLKEVRKGRERPRRRRSRSASAAPPALPGEAGPPNGVAPTSRKGVLIDLSRHVTRSRTRYLEVKPPEPPGDTDEEA